MLYPAILPTDGAIGMLDALINWLRLPASASLVHLYTNNYVPIAGTVLASFTEATFGGYSSMGLGIPTQLPVSPDGRAAWVWPQSIWTANGVNLPTIVYGYWVDFLDPLTAGRRVGWAQRFQSAQGLWALGQTIRFTLSFGAKQC
jgi:hypothetical protein